MALKKQPLTSTTQSEFTLEALRQIALSAFTEVRDADGNLVHKVDFEVLRELLGDAILDNDEERFGFHWVGKQEAKRAAAEPIHKTLRPVVEESLDWDTTENLYIEGDNLEVLKLLQRAYLGKVKMIYIDPPYNTGNDFVYDDDFAMSGAELDTAMGNLDAEGNRLRKNLDSSPRYHSDWCSMIYSRLLVARTLLANDGVIFISIDDNEVHHLRKICDEVFGCSNFVAELMHQRAKGGGQAKYIVKGHDYILVYASNLERISLTRKKVVQQRTIEIDGELYIKNDDVLRKTFGKKNKANGDRRCFYEQIEEYKGVEKKREIDRLIENGELFLEENKEGMHTICRYEKVSEATSKLYSIIKVLSEEGKKDLEALGILGFSYPKPKELLIQLLEAGSNKDSLILDFFSGSATIAHAVMQLNAEDGGKRKYICVQLPEATPEGSEARKAGYSTICEIGKERIRRAGEKIKEEHPEVANSLDTGFRVLRVDSSNMEDVYFEPAQLSQTSLFSHIDNVKEGRTELDLLFGCMVDWGVNLSLPLRKEEVAGRKLHIVNAGELVACFDSAINLEVIRYIAGLNPLRVILRETCFTSDVDKLNLYEQFKQFCGWSDEEAYKRIHVI